MAPTDLSEVLDKSGSNGRPVHDVVGYDINRRVRKLYNG